MSDNFSLCGDHDDNTELFLGFLENGLPKQESIPKSSIIVVGAGISGLTAAKLLKDRGHNVTILEASDRVGGRIQTYRDLAVGNLLFSRLN